MVAMNLAALWTAAAAAALGGIGMALVAEGVQCKSFRVGFAGAVLFTLALLAIPLK
jgi:hypothetical protein